MKRREKYPWIYDLLFLLVFMLAGYLRLTGVDWGEGQHQHPDENFLEGVLLQLQSQKCANESIPVEVCPSQLRQWISLADYFNSKTSPLNPYNRGFNFYVYGDLPLTLTRVAVDASQITDVKYLGRQFSALADLFTILFLYLAVSRLYNRRIALLASLFSALAVMQIQQSHFFTTDLFVNTFAFLAIYFAVRIQDTRYSNADIREDTVADESLENPEQEPQTPSDPEDHSEFQIKKFASQVIRNPLFLLSIAFGIAFGMAMASKVNIFPLALLLPGAFVVRHLDQHKDTDFRSFRDEYWYLILVCLVAGGLAATISFRVFQPYAFKGLGLDPQWVANIQEQRVQAQGIADLPWNLQWARRSHLYSFENLTKWGLGLPLGILAWAGFLLMGWRIFKGQWRHALLWGWTALYFFWQSLQFNPTMRYQLPIYPLLCMMAAWFVFELAGLKVGRFKSSKVPAVLAGFLGVAVVLLTAAWAFAFHSIYLRDEPRMAASRWIFQNVPGPINVQIHTGEDGAAPYNQPLSFPTGGFLRPGTPYDTSFVAEKDGVVDSISLGHALNSIAPKTILTVSLANSPNQSPNDILASSSFTSDFPAKNDPRGESYTLKLDKPVAVQTGHQYFLRFLTSAGMLRLQGAAVSNETDYDYGLPFRIDNYDAYGGIYRGDLTEQVYWDDNADKLNRFVDILNQTDYIFIPTNHQYAQITRLPERYPLTTYYYRELMGCPPDANIIKCYYEAKPGDYKGRLGFDLVAVFDDYPKLGNFEINDQYAEEAFTFYDHPKVLIFKKNKDFNIQEVQSSLGSVDLSQAVHLTPPEFSHYSNLMLPAAKLALQRTSGTWSQLFDYNWVWNKYPILGLLIWYVFIFILGLAVYPLVRLTMPGLADKGYPLSRALGLVLFGYLAWIGGSLGVPYTRTTIAIIFILILILGGGLAWYQRAEIGEEWRAKWKYFLMMEGLFLGFFAFDLLIRLGNPDLWHPAKGGERPMDFSYLNAVIKSTSFPPYDPWFEGGYINYYYYGFVLVGTPIKLLGIVPSIAYNFVLPTLFAIVAMCAFSLGWNLIAGDRGQGTGEESLALSPNPYPLISYPFISGLAASAFTILLGNLGTIQMIYQRLQQLGSAGAFDWDPAISIFERLGWAAQGLLQVLKGTPLAFGFGDWYWYPSRVVPPLGGNEITEFPLFTFIYSDLHAHMIAMPLALLALSWALAVVLGHAKWRNRVATVLGFVVGGLIIGALYPSNLSDMYTYLPIGLVVLGYIIWRYADSPSFYRRLGLVIAAVFALTLLSFLMYQPYREWYRQVYSALDPWKGPFTPIGSYLTHWSLLLFVVVAWMAWETHEWMAETPVSALRKLKPYQLLIEGFIVLVVLILLVLQYRVTSLNFPGVSIAWIAFPIAAWAGILLLRPNLPDTKRFVLFLIGTALIITIVVEVVVVRGDIGRQNTIFKFYLQAWFLLAISAGAALAWTLPAVYRWSAGWLVAWQTAMILLVSGALLFTITGSIGKIRDRWILEAPHTLDSMTYMKYAQYDDFGQRMDLSQDYRAIRWMQDNVKGSPVIVEANCTEYHWCTRFTIYTGLPGVVGWNWHQRQQRGLLANWVEDRVTQIGDFYNSVDIDSARSFLKKYDVSYIIVGPMEHAEYTPEGIAKFKQYDGKYWRAVYHDGDTAIYQVIPQ